MALIKKLRKAVGFRTLMLHCLFLAPRYFFLQFLYGGLAISLIRTLSVMLQCMLVQKREAPAGEKPEPVRTHLRNMIIVPEMIGSVIGVYNGKTFNQVEIKVSALTSLSMAA